jgi:tripartite-type tricarboxylate transporter receptor subunit TctC
MFKKMLTRTLFTAVLAATAGSAFAADATDWPKRPVQVVVPANAGGDTDFNARTMAKYFTQLTGKAMVITNMAGGGGTIAVSQVQGAKPDGNTILFAHTGQLVVNEVSGLTEDSFEVLDIACIAAVDKGAVFVSSKASGIKDVKDLVDKAKAAPGTVVYGTEMGGFSHLQGLMFEKLAGVKLKFVDSGTAAEKVTSLLGGRADLGAISFGVVQDYVTKGDMVTVAQPNAERNPLLGEIKTFREQGIDMVMDKPYVIAFPKGTDPAIIARMSALMKQITEKPEYAQDLEKAYKQPVSFHGTAEAIDILNKTRANYMQYTDVLRQGGK